MMTFAEWFLAPVLIAIHQLRKDISMNQLELEAKIDAQTAVVEKIKGEVVAVVEALRAEIAAGAVTSAGVNAAVERLDAALKSVDDLNPDAPTPV